MNYSKEYNSMFSSEKRVARLQMKNRRIYRITLYEYMDKSIKRMSRNEADLIFVTGIHQKFVHGLRLNELNPDLFMEWLKTITIKNMEVGSINHLDEITKRMGMDGKQLFEQYIKSSRIYKSNMDIYRTYYFKGIRFIKEVNLKEDVYMKNFQGYKITGLVDKPKNIR